MNLALNYCWKEWRAQRGRLLAYTLLVFTCLCIGLFLMPQDWRVSTGFGTHALSWFVTAGTLGVVAFVVPSLVRSEITSNDDQFVRRLPNALLPAFVGKSLFLVLVAISLPLVGLVVGEQLLLALGYDCDPILLWQWDGQVFHNVPSMLFLCGAAVLLLPWIWAVGTWLPGGRLAVLGTVLLGLLIGVGVFAVERQAPNIFSNVTWQSWSWTVPLLGTLVAGVSWCRGRRGGGPLRSARVGLLATAVVILPFAGWIAQRSHRYHHPDASQLQSLEVRGMSPTGRHALVRGAEEIAWYGAWLRLDLQTGEATQVSGFDSDFTGQAVYPTPLAMHGTQRYWRGYSIDDQHVVYDLTRDAKHAIRFDRELEAPVLPAPLLAEVRAELADACGLLTPDGSRVLLDGEELVFVSASGDEERMPSPLLGAKSIRAAGHAFKAWGAGGDTLFDLARRQVISVPDLRHCIVVGRCLLFQKFISRSHQWLLQRGDEEAVTSAALDGCEILGLFDHRRLLVCQKALRGRPERVFLLDPDTEEQTPCDLGEGVSLADAYAWAPIGKNGTLLQRDPNGLLWFLRRDSIRRPYVRLDPQTLQVLPVDALAYMRGAQLLRWQELPEVVMHDDLEVVRIHIETGERTVLFPRQPSSSR